MTSVLSRYVDPQVLNDLARHSFQPRELVAGHLAGGHKSPLAGFAVEFAGHREYVPGDDPKYIDWRVYFNRDKYFTKQFEVETNCVAYLLVDDSQSMDYGSGNQRKWEYACRLAMTLAQLIVRRRDQVTLWRMGNSDGLRIPPGNTLVQLIHLATSLDRCPPAGEVDVGSSLREAAGLAKRRGVVFVISDLFCDLQSLASGLQQLLFERREVILLQVVHADEMTFPFAGAVEFTGLEDLSRLQTTPEDIRQAYLQALADYQHNLCQICYRHGCEHVLLSTDRPLARQLVQYLDRSQRQPRLGRTPART